VALRAQGLSLQQIATTMGVSNARVWRLLDPDKYVPLQRERMAKLRAKQQAPRPPREVKPPGPPNQVVRRQRLRAIISEAKGTRCWYCGIEETGKGKLDFHHRDPATKCFKISSAVRLLVSPTLLREEIAKCDVLCKECHQQQ
jgi:hypothetical protein